MASLFSRIINGEIPCYKIAEDKLHFAFLDISPLTKGHTLVIPKKEVDYIFDLSDEELSSLHLFAKKVAIALKKAIPCQRVGVSVIGMEVPHAHIHLIPFSTMGEMNFSRPKLHLQKDEFLEIAEKIKSSF